MLSRLFAVGLGMLVPALAAVCAPGTAAAEPAQPPQPAQAEPCRLALVLALDVSASVDAGEYILLRDGTAAALLSPDVRAAVKALGGVYISVFEWSGRQKQTLIQPWRVLDGDSAIRAVAERIATHPRSESEYPTALGSALGYAQRQLAAGPSPCNRQVIDVSGDGANNHGFSPESAYRAFDFSGVTVNGLVVAGSAGDAVDYYRRRVIRGPAAFVEIARGYEQFEEAMRRKLLREIGVMSLSDADPARRSPHP
ncbi:MAG: DUF1194 domain-containing protein [Pseudomonadota bacterium]